MKIRLGRVDSSYDILQNKLDVGRKSNKQRVAFDIGHSQSETLFQTHAFQNEIHVGNLIIFDLIRCHFHFIRYYFIYFSDDCSAVPNCYIDEFPKALNLQTSDVSNEMS